MPSFLQSYNDRFQAISIREQILILVTGIVVIGFVLYSLFIEENRLQSETLSKNILQIENNLASTQQTINVYEQALSEDPNTVVNEQILEYENKLGQIDIALLSLTSDLINPIQMRFALSDLLKLQKGVSLLAFDVLPAQSVSLAPTSAPTEMPNSEIASSAGQSQAEIDANINSLTLYKHGIKLTLSGSYFQLRNYLVKLEQLKWTFFWHKFDYKLKQYPNGILEVQLYSLSTKREFIGV
ncbi:hypothetical protein ACOYR1_02075 [Thalassotalea piscium]